MKVTIMLVLLFLYAAAIMADEVEVLGPRAITYHVMHTRNASQYANKLSGDGELIDNPEYGLSYTYKDKTVYTSFTGFIGQESVGSPMEGLVIERGYYIDHWQLGLALGGYAQNDKDFTNKGLVPFRIAQIGTTGLVPIAGIAINYKIDLPNHTFIKLNNILSPIITNSVLSLGWGF